LPKLATIIHKLSKFAIEYKDMATLGYSMYIFSESSFPDQVILTLRAHYQPAQLITVGRRAAQWVQDLMMDLEDIEKVRADLRFR
jgi:adenylosuccinate lyase